MVAVSCEALRDSVVEGLADVLGKDLDEIGLDFGLMTDLEADFIDIAQFGFTLEQKLQVPHGTIFDHRHPLPEEELRKATVRDVIDFVRKKITPLEVQG